MSDEMQEKLERLERELAELKAQVAEKDAPAATTRRAMLRTVVAGAAGAAVAGVAGVRPAAAFDGFAFVQGAGADVNNRFQTRTIFTYDPASGPVPRSLTVQTGNEALLPPALTNDAILTNLFPNAGTAFLGVAMGNSVQRIGVIGWSRQPDGTGVVGFTGGQGRYGGEFFGGQADLRLRPDGLAPIEGPPVVHDVGELFEDATGTLWLCVAAGTPGVWRELAGLNSAGAFHAVGPPQRVYDSRGTGGPLGDDVERVVSVATTPNGVPVVPPGATAVAMTFTVTNTEASGFMSVRPAATVYTGTSSINWFGPGQHLATTVISGLTNREVIVRGGENRADFVIDVTGYYR